MGRGWWRNDGERIHAIFREGIGCVVTPPSWDVADNDSLPTIDLSYQIPFQPVALANGRCRRKQTLAPGIDEAALGKAEQWAFERDTPEQNTVSLLVVHKGNIVLERYADGFDRTTRTRTWSTAKVLQRH